MNDNQFISVTQSIIDDRNNERIMRRVRIRPENIISYWEHQPGGECDIWSIIYIKSGPDSPYNMECKETIQDIDELIREASCD